MYVPGMLVKSSVACDDPATVIVWIGALLPPGPMSPLSPFKEKNNRTESPFENDPDDPTYVIVQLSHVPLSVNVPAIWNSNMFPGEPSLTITTVHFTELVESSRVWMSAAIALLFASVSEILNDVIAESVTLLNPSFPVVGSPLVPVE